MRQLFTTTKGNQMELLIVAMALSAMVILGHLRDDVGGYSAGQHN